MKLEGIRVIDLSRFLPGPIMTQVMVDHGAEVIKVETIGEGEPTRVIGETRDDVSVYFANTNRGKKSIALDLKQPAGVEALMRLAEASDVFVEAFRPGLAERLGVGYRQVAQRAPHIVYVSMSSFGQSGPYRDLATHDLAVQAMTGVLSITLGQDGKPAIPGLAGADMLASMIGLSAVLMALLRRKDTGRGDAIDVSMAESLLACIPNNLSLAMARRRQPDARESRALGGNALYALYETKDRAWIALAGAEMKFAVNLLTALGRPDLIELCKLPPGRGQLPVREFLQEAFRTKTRSEWVAYFKGRDIPFAPVNTLPEVLDDAHFRQRGAVVTDARGWDHVATPIRFADEPGREQLAPPALGQHSLEVLRSIGYSTTELSELREKGVIAEATPEEIARHSGVNRND